MPRKLDLIGQQFGRLLVVREGIKKSGSYTWECVCECGEHSTVRGAALKNGNTTSCGCWKKEVLGKSTTTHGMFGTKVHTTWAGLLRRCRNKNSRDYPLYGGRGVSVCKKWLSFENFFADMGNPPRGYSIDRRNPNGNYNKRNCRWATSAQQGRTKRNNRWLTYYGKKMVLSDWASYLGSNVSTLHRRLKKYGSLRKVMKEFYGDVVLIKEN